jgi:hypothetical protein
VGGPVGIAAEDAARLQAKVEQWQDLAARQQTVAIQLGELISAQRALTEQWSATDDDELASAAARVDAQLRSAADDVLTIEELVLSRMQLAVSDLGRVLREH